MDLYQNATSVQNRRVVFVAKDLAPGTTHTLKVYVAGTKNPSSTDTRVDIDGFVILK